MPTQTLPTQDDFSTAKTLPRGEVPRKYGRPELPHPVTGETVLWQRPSKLGDAIEDDYLLQRWKQRMVAKGVAMRSDLRALAYAAELADYKTLNDVAWEAQKYAGSLGRANQGTARHKLFEPVDRDPTGWTPGPDNDFNAEIWAWRRALELNGITLLPDWIERFVLDLELLTAGSLDRVGQRADWALPRVVDIKTGEYDKIMQYSQLGYSAQIAVYARAGWCLPVDGWHPDREGRYGHPIMIDQTVGCLVVFPPGCQDPRAVRFVDVDLAEGYENARQAVDLISRRGRKTYLVPAPWALEAVATPVAVDAGPDAAALAEGAAVEGPAGPLSEPVAAEQPAPDTTAPTAPAEAAEAPTGRRPRKAATPRKRAAGAGRPTKAELAAEAAVALAGVAGPPERLDAAVAELDEVRTNGSAPTQTAPDPAPAELAPPGTLGDPYLIAAIEILTPPGQRCAIVGPDHQAVALLLRMIDQAPDQGALSKLWTQWTEAGRPWRQEYTQRAVARAEVVAPGNQS